MNKYKYLVVFNPLSGKKGYRYLEKLKKALAHASLPYDVYYTNKDAKSDELYLKSHVNRYTDIISMGGDGTLNMLCNVLAHKAIPLGIIPCGTGNDFTRNIYNKSHDVISVVTGSKLLQVDLGHCHDRYFINVLGIGYDAMMVRETMNNRKVLFRSLFYLLNALRFLPFYQEKNLHLKIDGRVVHEKTFIAAFGNGAFFGNGIKITPRADIADGLLDCCWIGRLSFLRRCSCLLRSFSGKHLSETDVVYTQAESFHVLSDNYPIEADGEFVGYTPATIKISKQALLIKIP